jgi:DNA-binding NarL/FixJ family response regulator
MEPGGELGTGAVSLELSTLRDRAARARTQARLLRATAEELLSASRGLRSSAAPRLSAREWTVFVKLNKGLSSKSIAAQLGIATPTVNSLIASVHSKLGLNGGIEASKANSQPRSADSGSVPNGDGT